MKMKKRGRDKGVRKDPLSFHKPSTLKLGVHSRWFTNERTSEQVGGLEQRQICLEKVLSGCVWW